MPGYADTMLQGMQGLAGQAMQMRRLQDMEQQQAFYRSQGMANTARQFQVMQNLERERQLKQQEWLLNQRRMQMQLEGTQSHQRATEDLARKALEVRIKGLEQRDQPPLKPGYMRVPANPNEMTPVPGGPAWRDLSSKHANDLQTLGTLDETTNAASSIIDRILDPKKKSWGFEPNFGGYNALVTQYLPGQTQDTRNDLENLKATLKTYGLGLIRSTSGAIGSITEREWPILEKQIESLSPLMSEEAAQDALLRIKNRMQGMKQRALGTYKQEWGDSPFFKKDPIGAVQAGGAGVIPQGVDPRDWKYMTPEERALWQTK